MSIFDSVEKQAQELDEHIQRELGIQNVIAGCLENGAHILESSDLDMAINKLEEMLKLYYPVLGNGIETEWLKKQQGRPVIRWDAKTFRKNDAIGSMYKLAKLPKDPKYVIIVENITEIPEAISEIYDDPILVENVLLHSWKDDTIYLTHRKYGPFELNRKDYSVIFPIRPGELKKLHFSVKGEIAMVRL